MWFHNLDRIVFILYFIDKKWFIIKNRVIKLSLKPGKHNYEWANEIHRNKIYSNKYTSIKLYLNKNLSNSCDYFLYFHPGILKYLCIFSWGSPSIRYQGPIRKFEWLIKIIKPCVGKTMACLKAKRLLNKLHCHATDELSSSELLAREATEFTKP